MARKKKTTINPAIIKFIIIAGVILAIVALGCKGIYTFLSTSEYFKVKSIVVHPTLKFISEYDFTRYKGENIFKIDLKSIEDRLVKKYPQLSYLKVSRRLPDQLLFIAKKRYPFAQIAINDRIIIMDQESVVIANNSELVDKLPLISGMKDSKLKYAMGLPIGSRNISVALNILSVLKDNNIITDFNNVDINVQEISKIIITMDNKMQIILDKDKIDEKVKVLGVIFAQEKIDFKQVKYIDLRFKEPYIGYK